MAEKKEVVFDKTFGDGTDFIVTRGKYMVGEVEHFKFAFKLNYPGQLPEEIETRFRNTGIRGIVDNRFAAVFRSSNDYGTEAEAQEYADKFSTDQGFIDAVTRKEPKVRVAAEKLDDAETLAIKYLTKAILQKAKIEKPSKEERTAAKGKAKELKAAGHKAYVALKKLADAEVAKRDKALEASDLLDD